VKPSDTKCGRRVSICVESILAAIEMQRDVLAPLEPIAKNIKNLLHEDISQETLDDIKYGLEKIEESIAKWRPSSKPDPDFLYIQPIWAGSIDENVQTACKLVAELVEDFAAGKFVQKKSVPKANPGATVTKGKAFVAMAIDPADATLEDVLDAVRAVCQEHGVDAKRVDEDQSNERITDRIMSSIRTAEFVIVDLTLGRPNVFFEAGFAHGLDKTPIYIARHGTKPEFDVKDYPIIFFRNMRELKTGLTERLKTLLALRTQTPNGKK